MLGKAKGRVKTETVSNVTFLNARLSNDKTRRFQDFLGAFQITMPRFLSLLLL